MIENKCPKCESPHPRLHPSVQFEGEVQVCSHPWHQVPVDGHKLQTRAELGLYDEVTVT